MFLCLYHMCIIVVYIRLVIMLEYFFKIHELRRDEKVKFARLLLVAI